MTKHDLARRAALSPRQLASILGDPSHRVAFGHAEVRVQDDRFVMHGPSGRHTLAVGSTDLRRLNAHWTSFATAEPNIPGVLPYSWEH